MMSPSMIKKCLNETILFANTNFKTTQNWFTAVAQYRHKTILSIKNRYAQAGTESRKNVLYLDGVVEAYSHFSVLRKSIIQCVESLFVETVFSLHYESKHACLRSTGADLSNCSKVKLR